jgi:two-component system, chemotaxis family, CheB/CheR fusion protein
MDETRQRSARETRELNTNLARHRVLVVDDNVDAAESLGMLLKMSGQEVSIAHNGHDGILQAREFRPELVLLDIGMPMMDGYEVCRRMRQEPCTQEAVVIALTGWGLEEDRQRALEEGFDHHLVKPVELQTLVKLLEDLDQDLELKGHA